jgi:hypothetical protein
MSSQVQAGTYFPPLASIAPAASIAVRKAADFIARPVTVRPSPLEKNRVSDRMLSETPMKILQRSVLHSAFGKRRASPENSGEALSAGQGEA